MITDIFINIYYYISSIISSLPDFQINENWLETLSIIVGYTMNFQYIVPVATMYDIILTLILFELVFFGVKMALMVVNWSRGTGRIEI